MTIRKNKVPDKTFNTQYSKSSATKNEVAEIKNEYGSQIVDLNRTLRSRAVINAIKGTYNRKYL